MLNNEKCAREFTNLKNTWDREHVKFQRERRLPMPILTEEIEYMMSLTSSDDLSEIDQVFRSIIIKKELNQLSICSFNTECLPRSWKALTTESQETHIDSILTQELHRLYDISTKVLSVQLSNALRAPNHQSSRGFSWNNLMTVIWIFRLHLDTCLQKR